MADVRPDNPDLLAALAQRFGGREFDATDVSGAAYDDIALAAALLAAEPKTKDRYGRWDSDRIRKVLRARGGLKVLRYPNKYTAFRVEGAE